jgi:N-acetylglucosamine-6-sulfatase
VPLLKGEKWQPRTSFLIEHFSDGVFARMRNMGYQAVRTERSKYIRYRELTGMDELYDLQADPYELKNLVQEPGSAERLTQLRAEMDRLMKEAP